MRRPNSTRSAPTATASRPAIVLPGGGFFRCTLPGPQPKPRPLLTGAANIGLLFHFGLSVDARKTQADGAAVAHREVQLAQALTADLGLDQPLLVQQFYRCALA